MNLKLGEIFKSAGELKIPQKTFEEVFEFIKNCYAVETSEYFKKIIQSENTRHRILNKIEDFNNEFTAISWKIEDLVEAYKNKDFDLCHKNINDLIDLLKIPLNLGKFNLHREDPLTGDVGSQTMEPSFFLRLIKLGSGNNVKFNVEFSVKLDEKSYFQRGVDDSNNKIIKLDEIHYELSFEEICEFFTEQYKSGIFNDIFNYLLHLKTWQVYDTKYFLHLKAVYAFLKKNTGDVKYDQYEKTFTVEAKDFPYDIKKFKSKNLTFTATFTPDDKKPNITNENWAGLWVRQPKESSNIFLGKLFVASDCVGDAREIRSISKMQEKFLDIKRTVRHELQHFMQNALGVLIDENIDDFKSKGLPSSKIRDLSWTPSGYDKSPFMLTERQDHPLRDVEFYTRLSDCIEEFKAVESLYPPRLKNLVIQGYIGQIDRNEFTKTFRKEIEQEIAKDLPEKNKTNTRLIERLCLKYENSIKKVFQLLNDPFFKKLKDHQPLKYRKAVIEFIKAVS